jgi:hypothetical protein
VTPKQSDGSNPLLDEQGLVKVSPTLGAISPMPISYDDVVLTFTHMNLLPRTDKIPVAPDISRTITSECFVALAYTYFGAKHNARNITQWGLQKYSRALTTVHTALTSRDVARSFDVLEAITIMALIEVS